jgi:hypothetical protein
VTEGVPMMNERAGNNHPMKFVVYADGLAECFNWCLSCPGPG